MRLLGLDVGDKRIGVALSQEGILARPLTVVNRRSHVEDFAALAALVREHSIERIVVGLPTSSEGQIGPQARSVKRYVRDMTRVLAVPVVFVDESYTTVDAVGIMTEVGQSSKKRRERVDAVAAAVILQSYLDADERRKPDSDSLPE